MNPQSLSTQEDHQAFARQAFAKIQVDFPTLIGSLRVRPVPQVDLSLSFEVQEGLSFRVIATLQGDELGLGSEAPSGASGFRVVILRWPASLTTQFEECCRDNIRLSNIGTTERLFRQSYNKASKRDGKQSHLGEDCIFHFSGEPNLEHYAILWRDINAARFQDLSLYQPHRFRCDWECERE